LKVLLLSSALTFARGNGRWEIRHRHEHQEQPGHLEEGGIAFSILSDIAGPPTSLTSSPTNSWNSLRFPTIHDPIPTDDSQFPIVSSLLITPVHPTIPALSVPATQLV